LLPNGKEIAFFLISRGEVFVASVDGSAHQTPDHTPRTGTFCKVHATDGGTQWLMPVNAQVNGVFFKRKKPEKEELNFFAAT